MKLETKSESLYRYCHNPNHNLNEVVYENYLEHPLHHPTTEIHHGVVILR